MDWNCSCDTRKVCPARDMSITSKSTVKWPSFTPTDQWLKGQPMDTWKELFDQQGYLVLLALVCLFVCLLWLVLLVDCWFIHNLKDTYHQQTPSLPKTNKQTNKQTNKKRKTKNEKRKHSDFAWKSCSLYSYISQLFHTCTFITVGE